MAATLEELFYRHKRRYGSRRLCRALQELGYSVGRHRVRRLMKQLSLRAIQPRTFVPKALQISSLQSRSANLLLSLPQGAPEGINQIVVGDITYLPIEGDWAYLAMWMDLFSRRVVGWAVGEHQQASLVVSAFVKVLKLRQPPAGLIVHTDGGGQYKSAAFRQLLAKHQCRQSMTRVNNVYDNAFIESLFSRLKAELLSDYPVFKNLEDARIRLFEYVEGYYNTIRKHSALGYKSPIEFEQESVKASPHFFPESP